MSACGILDCSRSRSKTNYTSNSEASHSYFSLNKPHGDGWTQRFNQLVKNTPPIYETSITANQDGRRRSRSGFYQARPAFGKRGLSFQINDNGSVISESQRTRTDSVASIQSEKPVFNKLSPVMCQDEVDPDSPCDKGQPVVNFRRLSDDPYEIKLQCMSSKQIVINGTPQTQCDTPQKWNTALKQVKCETLGLFIERASVLLTKAQSKSFSSSSSNSFLSKSKRNVRFNEKNNHSVIPSKPQTHKSVLSITQRKVLGESIKQLSPDKHNRNKMASQRKTLMSFQDNPFCGVKSLNSVDCRNSMSERHAPFVTRSSLLNLESKLNINKADATELQEFIELEDYCRRSTAKDSSMNDLKGNCNQSSVRSSVNQVYTKSASLAKSKAKPKRRQKQVKESTSHLVKTMSITICRDSKIMYT